MFITRRDDAGGRRNRVYSTNSAARSSKLSLLTLATTSSGGSNSTITQESYNRAQSKMSHRRKRSRDHRSRTHRTNLDGGQTSPKVEVFDYLVDSKTMKTKAQAQAESQTEPESECDSDDKKVTTVPDTILHMEEEDPEGYYRSMSDSGISMGSNSSGQSVKGVLSRSYLPVLPEESSSWPASTQQHQNELALVDPRWIWHSSSPGPYSEGCVPPAVPQPPTTLYDPPIYPPCSYPSYEGPCPSPECYSHTPSINIREPYGRHYKPEYFRSFTKLSTRLLLQLQDEIAEMEEEINSLDEESDAVDDASECGYSSSDREVQASRIRREHLYAELHAKLDQYCKSVLDRRCLS